MVAAAVTAGVLVACGGGGSPAPSKAAYVAAADVKCKAVKEKAKTRPAAGDDLEKRIANVQASIDDTLGLERELRAMKPPSGDKIATKKVVDDLAATARNGTALLQATRNNDMKAVTAAVDALTASQAKATADASAYGFKECGIA
jgi:uncharacterized protein YijF (DUF1287 family)